MRLDLRRAFGARPGLPLAVAAFALTLLACSAEPDDDGAIPPTMAGVQTRIFDVGCNVPSCHGAKAASGGLVLDVGQSHGQLVGVAAVQKKAAAEGKIRVVAGDPDASFLLVKCKAGMDAGYGKVMPFGDDDGLPAHKLAALRAWIAAGAPK